MRTILWLRRVLPLILLLPGCLLANIPSTPPAGYWLHDYANILSTKDRAVLQERQRLIYKQSGTPIVIVTVSSMSAYLPDSTDIGSFARIWFDSWGIGRARQNTGMLLLVSTGDRKVRIELGGDWERHWDDLAKHIIDDRIVPHFKNGAYAKGITAGFDALARMAIDGPSATPPNTGPAGKLMSTAMFRFARANNPFVALLGHWTPYAFGLGVILVLFGIGVSAARQPLLFIGLSLVGLILHFWLTLALIVLYLVISSWRTRDDNWDSWRNRWDYTPYHHHHCWHSSSSWDSWGSSSGWSGWGDSGGGGGSSGGGGASGSW